MRADRVQGGVAYVPFDQVATDAYLVIVGITPWLSQAAVALAAARQNLANGVKVEEALRRQADRQIQWRAADQTRGHAGFDRHPWLLPSEDGGPVHPRRGAYPFHLGAQLAGLRQRQELQRRAEHAEDAGPAPDDRQASRRRGRPAVTGTVAAPWSEGRDGPPATLRPRDTIDKRALIHSEKPENSTCKPHPSKRRDGQLSLRLAVRWKRQCETTPKDDLIQNWRTHLKTVHYYEVQLGH